MSDHDIDELAAAMLTELQSYWDEALESGLPGHDREAHSRAIKYLKAYAEALKQLPSPASSDDIRRAIANLFKELNGLNAERSGTLLETDEREIIVPFIVDAARARGMGLADEEDPTIEFRSF
ncbi:MAG: hypothetical protein PVI23_09440 [Maricaulaceae bacterium]